jgi:uncharacterized protein
MGQPKSSTAITILQRYLDGATLSHLIETMKFISQKLSLVTLLFSMLMPSAPAMAENPDATPQSDTFIASPVAIPRAPKIKAHPALWVVKDADTTIYLFGTIHILKPELSWFDGAVRDAFAKSDSLVLELVNPPAEEVQKIYMALALNNSGKTARAMMTQEERGKYEAALTKIGLEPASLDPFDPWAAAVTLQLVGVTQLGFDPNSGVEATLTSAAKATKKPILGLETMEFQLGTLDQIPLDKQIRFLLDSVTELEDAKAGMDDLVDKWAKPDPMGLARLMNDSISDPYIFDALFTKRNANWAKWIAKRMDQPGTVFLAVGAGHLSGKTSVPEMLKSYGMKTKRVKR